MLVRNQLRVIALQKAVIIALLIALLVTVVRIWKFDGKGASEWYTEYQMVRYENERLVRCMFQFDSEIFYKRQDGVVRYCKVQ